MSTKKDYTKSFEIFNNWRDKNRIDGSFGNCMWQIESESFMLECWDVHKFKELRIFQIFPDGRGFIEWKSEPY